MHLLLWITPEYIKCFYKNEIKYKMPYLEDIGGTQEAIFWMNTSSQHASSFISSKLFGFLRLDFIDISDKLWMLPPPMDGDISDELTELLRNDKSLELYSS